MISDGDRTTRAGASDGPNGTLAEELRSSIMRTSRRIRTESATGGVTQSQYAVLAALRSAPSTVSLLAEREHIRPPSMTRTVDALEQRQLVTRTVDPTDRRHVFVDLTDTGRALINETRRRRTEWLDVRLAGLAAADQEILAQAAEILKKMSAL
jgi:DNA-binding MarR family transcriptional regulator